MKPTNDKYSYLMVALGTVLFSTILLPMLDSASSWVQNKFNYQNAKLQAKLNQETAQEEPENVRAVGFSIPSEEYEGCEEDE